MKYIFEKYRNVKGLLHVPAEVVTLLHLKEGDLLVVINEKGEERRCEVVRRSGSYFIKYESKSDEILKVVGKVSRSDRE